MARQKIDKRIPRYNKLVQPVFAALKKLGGSGSNADILDAVIEDLNISDEVADILHKGNPNKTELAYQADWARTYLRRYGAITNSARGVWSIVPKYASVDMLDEKDVVSFVTSGLPSRMKKQKGAETVPDPEDDDPSNDYIEFPDELKPWKDKLAEVIRTMDPFAFERLSQRLLRECGFTNVEVTNKTRDGGIDGTGKLRINGVFSFTVAFQCKRYSGVVPASDVRDFRGSLSTDIEKGVMITTGIFSKKAKEEACSPGKKQIDLMDGEDFINKLVEYELGVKPVVTYEIDEEFFRKI